MSVNIEVPGVEIGHWTDAEARTGCTVIVLPPGTVASGEVRGGAPATRDFAMLAPERLVECVDAVVLTGGSAFGLAAADGVMQVLEAEGRGFETPHGRVPIVVAMALYDLGEGDASVRPGAAEGRRAATDRATASQTGAVGAGTGATTSKWLGAAEARAAGLGIASVRRGELVVCAVVALNAAGTPAPAADALLEEVAAGSFTRWPRRRNPLTNTTLCAIVTNAALTKLECFWVAQGGHDGLARALVPAHCRSDGDAVLAAATAEAPTAADVDDVRLMAVAAVVKAVQGGASGAAPPRSSVAPGLEARPLGTLDTFDTASSASPPAVSAEARPLGTLDTASSASPPAVSAEARPLGTLDTFDTASSASPPAVSAGARPLGTLDTFDTLDR